jgi:hypothetical protein
VIVPAREIIENRILKPEIPHTWWRNLIRFLMVAISGALAIAVKNFGVRRACWFVLVFLFLPTTTLDNDWISEWISLELNCIYSSTNHSILNVIPNGSKL